MKSFGINVVSTLVALALLLAIAGAAVAVHRRHVRTVAQAGLRSEIEENHQGVQQLRSALVVEAANITAVADLLRTREAGRPADGHDLKLGLDVMAFTDANWRAASATGALETMDYDAVARFAAAYFEQARLAQLQTTTLDAMMALQSSIGHGEQVASLSPEQARIAEVQARLLLAHLRSMSRMSDGLDEAYTAALPRA